MKPKNSRTRIPSPPAKRREPLPWQKPKPAAEDAGAPARLKAILSSASYRKADEDISFLDGDEARGPRLQLDYLKAEVRLTARGIKHTIVVFGSTRILEPIAAKRRVRALEKAFSRKKNDKTLRARLATAKRILAKSRFYDIAREFGRLVSQSGAECPDRRLVVMTGGGPGIMEAANRGAFDCGAESIGLNISLPNEQYPNPYITPDLCFLFRYFALRKLHFLHRARALVAFPGGYGTLDELFEALSLIQTRKIKPLPVILVGRDYWQKAFDVDFLVEEGTIDAEDRDLIWFAESAAEIWDGILHWYEAAGEPLCPTPSKSADH
jgi:uncharacterized protein (TIGR00730 family)